VVLFIVFAPHGIANLLWFSFLLYINNKWLTLVIKLFDRGSKWLAKLVFFGVANIVND
jgi:hypothetical protein